MLGHLSPNPNQVTDFLNNVRIVMVNTSHPGNIGAAARVMKNNMLSVLSHQMK